MILVYVCPECQAVRIVSRRKEVRCIECNGIMKLSELSFLKWTEMSLEQRKDYGRQWCEEQKKEKPK